MSNEKPFKLDMPFEEALRRLAQTDVKDLPEGARLAQKQKAAREKKGGTEEGFHSAQGLDLLCGWGALPLGH